MPIDNAQKWILIVKTLIQENIEKIWEFRTSPKHIMQWNYASDDWYTPSAENDLQTGGKFKFTMAARDWSFGFDFEWIYTSINKLEYIEYNLLDNRNVKVFFSSVMGGIHVIEKFEMEHTHSEEQQKVGRQAILNNFKKYVENNK